MHVELQLVSLSSLFLGWVKQWLVLLSWPSPFFSAFLHCLVFTEGHSLSFSPSFSLSFFHFIVTRFSRQLQVSVNVVSSNNRHLLSSWCNSVIVAGWKQLSTIDRYQEKATQLLTREIGCECVFVCLCECECEWEWMCEWKCQKGWEGEKINPLTDSPSSLVLSHVASWSVTRSTHSLSSHFLLLLSRRLFHLKQSFSSVLTVCQWLSVSQRASSVEFSLRNQHNSTSDHLSTWIANVCLLSIISFSSSSSLSGIFVTLLSLTRLLSCACDNSIHFLCITRYIYISVPRSIQKQSSQVTLLSSQTTINHPIVSSSLCTLVCVYTLILSSYDWLPTQHSSCIESLTQLLLLWLLLLLSTACVTFTSIPHSYSCRETFYLCILKWLFHSFTTRSNDNTYGIYLPDWLRYNFNSIDIYITQSVVLCVRIENSLQRNTISLCSRLHLTKIQVPLSDIGNNCHLKCSKIIRWVHGTTNLWWTLSFPLNICCILEATESYTACFSQTVTVYIFLSFFLSLFFIFLLLLLWLSLFPLGQWNSVSQLECRRDKEKQNNTRE